MEWKTEHVMVREGSGFSSFDASVRPVSNDPIDGVMFLVGRNSNKPPRFDEPVVLGISINWIGDQFAWEFDSAAEARSFIRRIFDSPKRHRDEPNKYIDKAHLAMGAMDHFEMDDYAERARYQLAAMFFWSRYYVTQWGNQREAKRALDNMDRLRNAYFTNKRRIK